jgi:hypothetical protein
MNGHAAGAASAEAVAKMQAVFPDGLSSLAEADPEVYGIIEDEKRRQWCAPPRAAPPPPPAAAAPNPIPAGRGKPNLAALKSRLRAHPLTPAPALPPSPLPPLPHPHPRAGAASS